MFTLAEAVEEQTRTAEVPETRHRAASRPADSGNLRNAPGMS